MQGLCSGHGKVSRGEGCPPLRWFHTDSEIKVRERMNHRENTSTSRKPYKEKLPLHVICMACSCSVLAFHSCQSLSLSIQSHLTLWHPTLIGSKGCDSTAAHMQIHATLATPMLIISLGWGRWGESDNELCLESQSTEQRPNLERCWHFLSFFLCMYLQSSWKRFHWYTRKVSSKRKYCRTWEWKTAH